jgi:predicted Zn-dependent protease
MSNRRNAALKLMRNGNVAGALALCDEILAVERNEQLYRRTKADLLLFQGRHDLAAVELEALGKLDLLTPGDAFKLSHSLVAIEDYGRALTAASQAISKLQEPSALRESFQFIIAYASFREGLLVAARDALRGLPDDYSDYFYGPGLTSKADLIEKINVPLA